MVNLLVPAQAISPFLNEEGEACSLCGALPDQKCKSEDKNTQSQKKVEPDFSPFV